MEPPLLPPSRARIARRNVVTLTLLFIGRRIATLLSVVHGVLFVVLPLEDYALMTGTAALFVALAAVMFFSRKIDWYIQDAGATPEAAR